MFSDLVASAKETLLERLTSPLIGSFVVAWPLWNYKFIVILLSNNTVTTTFQLIDIIAFPTWWTTLWRGLVAPGLSALAYVFIYPYPATWVFRFVRNHQANLNRIRLQIEGAELLSVEQSRQIRNATRIEIAQLRGTADNLMTELEQEKVRSSELAKQLASLQAKNLEVVTDEFPTFLEAGEVATLRAIGNALDSTSNSAVSSLTIAGESGESRTRTEYWLDKLSKHGFVEGNGTHYWLTAKGRRAKEELSSP